MPNLEFLLIDSVYYIIMAVQLINVNRVGDKPTVLQDDDKSIENYTSASKPVLHLKDLGPQVNWRTVFITEYAGPLVIHQLAVAKRGMYKLSTVQLVAWAMVTFHYMKRLYESLFVHRFSHASMPLSGCLKNCLHYWVVGGLWLSYEVYYSRSYDAISFGQMGIVAMFILCEMGNLYSHLQLRWLRPEGTKKRAIPTGFPFTLVSCPNYFFEVAAWISFALLVKVPSAWIFALLGAGQMWLWAEKKHKAYLKEFPQ
jgi:very-long-chain enoyl-CoA reductase